jgi:hypothetical protein
MINVYALININTKTSATELLSTLLVAYTHSLYVHDVAISMTTTFSWNASNGHVKRLQLTLLTGA